MEPGNMTTMTEQKAINYWWGLSAGVVDVIHSQNLPIGTRRLVQLLKDNITRGEFNRSPESCIHRREWFSQIQTGRFLRKRSSGWTGWQRNVIGSIPAQKELTEQAKPVTQQSGTA